jgi:hypothetical protein
MKNTVSINQIKLTYVLETNIAREMTYEFQSSNTRPNFDNIYVSIEPIKFKNTTTKSIGEIKKLQSNNKPVKKYPPPKQSRRSD